ncbi:MAG TPA: hypothetical protein VIY08_14200 [Candidatus Nitrosocosmicus sp.]
MLAKNPNELAINVKDLSILDFSLMSFMSYEFKKKITTYIKIDSFTAPDPFPIRDNLDYFIIVDKLNTNRIVSFVAIINDLDNSIWEIILGNDLLKMELPPNDIISLKQALMPKNTNNFYPVRKDGLHIGYIAFAFEICGKKDI